MSSVVPRAGSDHSYLNATTGSTLVALWAGTYPATNATHVGNSATAANVTGSVGFKPNSKDALLKDKPLSH